MPNRIIKESICTSENIDNLTPEEEVFFYRLLVCCDDYGRTDARPQILRAKCFPLRVDKVKEKDIEKWLNSLAKQQLIILYTVEGKPYLQVTTWDKHQQIRAKHSKHPAPSDENVVMISSDINCNQIPSYVPENRESRIENTRIRESNTNTKQETKTKYADNVSMTEEEYNRLVTKYGEPDTRRMIEVLDNYKGAHGKRYRSDYKAILTWVVEKVTKENQAKPPPKPKRQLIVNDNSP